MSRKGGYKILNLSDLFFDTGTSKEVPGIYDLVSALESKVTLISGLDIDDVPQDDMFVTWVNDSGTYKATIGDQTIAVASDDTVLITDGIIGGGGSGPTTVDAEDVTYDNSTSGLEAENVQDAIDELAGKEPPTPQIDADDVDYDNTDSGLQATNVQDAIDEVKGLIPVTPTIPDVTINTTNDPTTAYASKGISSISPATMVSTEDKFDVNLKIRYSGANKVNAQVTFRKIPGYTDYWRCSTLVALSGSYGSANPLGALDIVLYAPGGGGISTSYSTLYCGSILS